MPTRVGNATGLHLVSVTDTQADIMMGTVKIEAV
nr:MAG TPA: hypothetical protein [Caudoviricetes sp.]